MPPEPSPLPVPALPAPETGSGPVERMSRFDGLIERTMAEAGARLVFRVPAHPGSGYSEIAALTRRNARRRSVTLVTLGADGATIAVAPVDPALEPFRGLARSFAALEERWALA